MEDKEIGELWRKAKLPVVIRLIRKLVEERAWSVAKSYYRNNRVERAEMLSCIKAALRDFDIEPETWK